MRKLLICLGVVALGAALQAPSAKAGSPEIANRWGQRFARSTPWQHGYYHTSYGAPVALVVPPTVNMSREMGWGVAQSTMLPIYHQFERNYPGYSGVEGYGSGGYAVGGGYAPGGLRPTPAWPSHTTQFGVYYIRGPW